MKFRGLDVKITPFLPDLSVAEYLVNPRLDVEGELRQRRGLAKSSNGAEASAITGVVATNNERGPFQVLQVGTTLVGRDNGAALWGDVQLERPQILAAKVGTDYEFVLTRGSDFATSFLATASTDFNTGAPVIPVGEFAIAVDEDVVLGEWTPPTADTYYFSIIERRAWRTGPESYLYEKGIAAAADPCTTCGIAQAAVPLTVNGSGPSGATVNFSAYGACGWNWSGGGWAIGVSYNSGPGTWAVSALHIATNTLYANDGSSSIPGGLYCLGGPLTGTVVLPWFSGNASYDTSSVTLTFG